MGPQDISRYRSLFVSDPSAFVEGARGFFKQAGVQETWDSVKFPLLLTLLTYGGLKAGTAWGRYAGRTGNPNGPIKGPILKVIESTLPKDQYFVYRGTPEYDRISRYRADKLRSNWESRAKVINDRNLELRQDTSSDAEG